MKETLPGIIYFLACTFSIQAQTLYSTTNVGGADGGGTIIKFMPATNDLTIVRAFKSNDITDGGSPTGSLVRAGNGKLYGMTQFGGSANKGVIFSFDPEAGSYANLKDFNGSDGANPFGGLMQANDGLLYGMTQDGGSADYGVIFSFDPSSATFTKLKDFDVANGGEGLGSLMQASNGKLYGLTYNGGSIGQGVIFSFDALTGIYTKLREFDYNHDGGGPFGSLMQATDGKLYGMTQGGGLHSFGVIFSFDPVSSAYTVVKNFAGGLDGADPQGSLIQAADGKLYAMTTNGGDAGGDGVIFSFDPSNSAYTVLKYFDNANGARPDGYFLQASDGKLYGMTYQGGSDNAGVIFSFDISSSTYNKLQDFDSTNGANAYVGSAFIEVPDGGPLPVTLISFAGKNIGTNNQLSWKVGSENNLNYYELQRSIDGQNFKGIAQIKAAGNNSYVYDDHMTTALSPIYYYRLKSVDKDGRFTYSVVVKITIDHKGLVAVKPNPFKNKLVVNIESLIQDNATLIITDIGGRELYKQNRLLSPGINVVGINETSKLSTGTYLLTIITSQLTRSIIVVKGN